VKTYKVEFMTTYRQSKNVRAYTALMAAVRKNQGVECEQVPDVFHPEDSPYSAEKRMSIDLAKQICARCPIINQCAEYAVSAQEEYGIWGGLTPTDRQQLRRK
jgi:Transcription factor WhiB